MRRRPALIATRAIPAGPIIGVLLISDYKEVLEIMQAIAATAEATVAGVDARGVAVAAPVEARDEEALGIHRPRGYSVSLRGE